MCPERNISRKKSDTLVGRHEELKILHGNLSEVMENRGQIVLLEGEAGVGKSRLAREFAKICLEQGFEIMKGRCLYYESTDPYIPFIEALGTYLKDDPGTTTDGETQGSFYGIPMSLIGAGLDEEEEFKAVSISDKRELMFDRVTRAVIKRSRDNPILLFIDDMQWIDEASAQLLHHLARYTKENRVLLLGAYRPEELTADDREFPLEKVLDRMKEERLVDLIKLNRLTFQFASKMIKNILRSDDLPQSFLLMVYRVTEGNPYYINEMLNSMMDEGVIDPYSYKWDPEKDLSDIYVPASIKEVTGRRLERLSKVEKKVLMYASVIGTEFSFEILEHTVNMDVIELLDVIDELIGQRLIHEKEADDEEIYRFGHVQTRAAIYDNMGRSRRRILHKQVGEAMEELYGGRLEEFYYSLSRHFHEGQDYQKAYEYSVKAGESAMKSYATVSAIEFLERALESLKEYLDVTDAGKKEEVLLTRIGKLSVDTSDWNKAVDTYEKLLKRAKTIDDRRLEELSTRKIAHVYSEAYKYDLATKYYNRALQIATDIRNYEGIADSNRGLGYIHWRSGELDNAIEHYEKAIEKAKGLKNKRILALTYIEMGNVYVYKGELDLGINYYKRSLQTLIQLGAYRELSRAYNNIGDCYMKMDDWDRAIDYFEKSGENAEKIMNRKILGWSYFNRAEALACRGDTREAMSYAKKAEKLMKNTNEYIGLSGAYRTMGISHIMDGMVEEALRYFQKTMDVLEAMDVPFEKAEIKYWQGYTYAEAGDKAEARRHYHDAKAILESIDARLFLEKIDKRLNALEAGEG